jgi:hypothetical protein
MSYRIQYDSKTAKYEVTAERPLRFPLLIFIFGTLFLAVFMQGTGVVNQIRALLIPGEEAVTVQAFQTMYADLRSGSGVFDAIYDFCRMVLHGK